MLIFVLLILISKQPINLWFMLGGIAGSYLPDCDNRYAPAGIFQLWRICKHREQTHSLYFSIVCGCIAGVFNLTLGIGIFIGMLLHCIGDLMTPMGRVEQLRYFFWPYKNNYRKSLYKKRS